ncbi:MAG TPA: T9SS type A sorting domain-containing protein [Flavobacterium sp.]|jgi:hypothetical protein|nr:T9SS type A sorting domain-containing protein [Flavobacterium sp.]
MKRFYFLALLFCALGNAQTYTFVNTTAPYANLTGTTSLNNGEAWDDPEYQIILPFNFVINGVSTNNLFVTDSYLTTDVNSPVFQVISPLSADLVDRGIDGDASLSPISYKVEGVAGSRIAKVEFNNCGSWSDPALTMFINFQVWLFETTNVIEFRYGPSSISDTDAFYGGETGGVIGLAGVDGSTGDLSNPMFLVGNAQTPTTTTTLSYITGTPSNGRLYRFSPTSLDVDSFAANRIQIYPNPASEVLKIGGLVNDSSYKIFDGSGKFLLEGNINATDNAINVSDLASGLYFIQLESSAAIKFLKS